MAIEEVVAVAVPVARALAHAHAEGIVHRDVKPENIFLVQRSQGRWGVKVVDFGIAKTPINPKLTSMGETLGSPLYMAPEMIRGEDDVDQRTDVYSFGVLLYLMLCGRLPFVDDNLLRVMQMHLSAPVPPPRAINPALSVELASILERALAKRPDDRYPSMDALLIDLEAALPAGSDRLLIEAQSGAARGETPFASTLAIPRTESQRSIRAGEPSQRTMRVAPLPSPREEPRLPTLRTSTTRRAVIVLGSALLSGVFGVIAYRQLAAHGGRGGATAAAAVPPSQSHATPALAPPVEPATPPPPPAAAPAPPPAAAPGPIQDAAHARVSAPVMDAAHARVTPAAPAPVAAPPPAAAPPPIAKRPIGRPKPLPVRREPLRPAKRVAPATPAPRARPAALPPAPPPAEADPPTAVADAAPPPQPAEPPPQPERETNPAPDPTPPAPLPQPTAPPPQPVAPPQPPPPPPPPKLAAPPKPAAGSLDAVPSVATLAVKGSLSTAIVRRSVERALGSLRSCYQTAARAGNATPAIDLQVRFEIDENSLATHVTTSGASFGSLASCAAGVVGQLHTQEAPDVGTAQVTVLIRFRPT
jgi:serine/threonine-protein kinase